MNVILIMISLDISMTFIFVHIPKTAGTSFRHSAAQSLKCVWDYGTNSPETSEIIKETVYSNRYEAFRDYLEREKVDLIAGHFPASKYMNI